METVTHAVIGDSAEQEKIEDESLYWSDLKDMEYDIANNLVVNVLAVDEIKNIYTDVLKKEKNLNTKIDGLIKTYGDISKDVEEAIGLLAPKVFIGEIVKTEDNVITNERIKPKSEEDIVKEDDILDYLQIANKLNTAGNELGSFATEAYINITAELGMKTATKNLVDAKVKFDKDVKEIVQENTIKD